MQVSLPDHLKKYCVDQNYERYTSIDQATWRYCLRQLKDFLSVHAHPCYLEGLEKTGISEDQIPKIEDMSQKLQEFGWTAMPVSGFIPPAAFMELQSLSILPIASDMRSLDHLLYTPAPDIVHEAAGHAPILIEPEYAAYLKQYAQVAKKAIISKEDLDLYEAIRELSDIKENPHSTSEQILACEKKLEATIKASTHVSEATELSRMNWWTAEYGLIGDLKNPKLFGAGLLSSVGESKLCLSEKVKKIPLTVKCIQQTYDITEPQPQLFVTPDFKTLVDVLEQMSEKMAYRVGGKAGLQKALLAKSVNTVELDTGLQISGVLADFKLNKNNEVIFLKFSSPTQISHNDQQLPGHSKDYHQHGYSCPVGKFKQIDNSLIYDSGLTVTGDLIKTENGIMTFSNCTVKYQDEILFQPDWGLYDIAMGTSVVSVFGGPADRKNYGDTDDFVAARVPSLQFSDQQKKLFSFYQMLRDYRKKSIYDTVELQNLFQVIIKEASDQWLLFIELLEMAVQIKPRQETTSQLIQQIENHLGKLKSEKQNLTSVIDDGVRLAYAQN